GLRGPFASVAAAVFLVLLPGIALAQRGVTVDDPGDHRLGIYVTTVLGLGLIALVAVWAWPETFPRPDSGEAGGGDWFGWSGSAMGLAGASALLTAGGLAISYAFRALGARLGWKETELVHAVMPVTRGEKWLFVVLCLAAGVSEEIVFRGFVPLFVLPWFGHYMLAALPVSLVFGILHAYQGAHGVARTSLLGLLLAAGAAMTGSLLPSMLAHAALNLLIGLVLGDSLLNAETERGNKWT
ncbi:MAG: CPBP family intramembrane metalloprotease, partial [Gemmatimonadetes bacterium]|nr:CPBP family intramembrane metalloprotease [Gemmatimonadota bacterium]